MFSSLSHSVPEAIEFAEKYGHNITLIVHKVILLFEEPNNKKD